MQFLFGSVMTFLARDSRILPRTTEEGLGRLQAEPRR